MRSYIGVDMDIYGHIMCDQAEILLRVMCSFLMHHKWQETALHVSEINWFLQIVTDGGRHYLDAGRS